MSLAAGQTLSFYEILAPIGAGGMGEVYRARDTRLGREVAIKVLPEPFAREPERLARFQREAKALATLNHPNVAQVYGIDQIGDTCFIAMELVRGKDLEELLDRGPLPVDESIDVCRQIATGLEAAHEAGVLHRDLKPANVRLTPDGEAKVLDFGLAKSVIHDAGRSRNDSVLTTEEGRLLGTPTYMAPEQARGRSIDRRVDVWAFGCVLYECLTGQRLCDGEGLGDVLVAVLEGEPDWSALPPETPAHVRALLARCLDKDPRTRLRDIGEARVALERGPLAPPLVPAVRAKRGVPRAAAPVLLLAALGAGGLLGRLVLDRPSAPVRPVVHQHRLTELAGMEEMPAVSPDGDMVAFVSRVDGKRQVFLRLLARGSPQQITHENADHSYPRWVDANTLVYYLHPRAEGESGSLRELLVPSSTPPRFLVAAEGEADVRRGETIATFREDGEGHALVLIDYAGNLDETVHRVPSAVAYGSPRWSPDGRHVAFEAKITLPTTEIRVMDLDAGETRTVVRASQTRGLAWLPDGSGLVYSSSAGSTLPYPPVFRLRTVAIDGSGDAPLPDQGAGYASYVEPDVTRDGKLVASRVALASDVWRYPVDGTPLENVRNATRITWQTGLVQVPSVSPDGEEVAYLSDSGGRANVWVTRIDGSRPPRQVTDERDPLTVVGIPVWSPRGDWIVYYKGRLGADAEEWLVRPDGTEEHRLVAARGAASWSRDGQWLYYMPPNEDPVTGITNKVSVDGGEPVPVRHDAAGIVVSSDGGTGYFSQSDYRLGEVWRASPLETGAAELLVSIQPSRLPLWPHNYALSPDDRWLATPLRDRGTTNLWLVSTADGSLRQVTDFGERATTIGRQVSWSSDGEHVFAALMETDADIVLFDGAL